MQIQQNVIYSSDQSDSLVWAGFVCTRDVMNARTAVREAVAPFVGRPTAERLRNSARLKTSAGQPVNNNCWTYEVSLEMSADEHSIFDWEASFESGWNYSMYFSSQVIRNLPEARDTRLITKTK